MDEARYKELSEKAEAATREAEAARRTLAASCLTGAEVGSKVEADALSRVPTVTVTCVNAPYAGVQARIESYEAMTDFFKARDVLKRAFPDAQIEEKLLERIEGEVVKAVLRDLELRLKKSVHRPWLEDMKRTVNAAVVRTVQEA